MADGGTNSDDFHVPVANLAQFQIDRMRLYGKSVALIDVKTEKQYTYADIIDRIQRLAAGLRKLGMRQGDILCAITFNTIEYHIIWYAVNLLGGTLQTASPLYTDEDLERRFRECKTKFLLTIPELTQRMTKLVFKVKRPSFTYQGSELLSKLIVIGEAEGYIPYDSLYTTERVQRPADINPRTAASVLLSSSGTTGLPKFVQLSHVNIVVNIIQCQECFQHRPGETAILALPVFHHYGIHAALGTALYNGVRTALMEKWDISLFFSSIEKYKASILPIVPAMAARIVKYPQRATFDLSSVRIIHSGSAPLGPGIEKQLKELFKLNSVSIGYGLTETGHNAGNSEHIYKSGSCGFIPRGVHVKITDPETGAVLGRNKTGEICIRGSCVTIGYLNNREANENAIDKEGFFKTGDLGFQDEDGFLFVVDRLKDLIKFKGLQVAPAELEDLVLKHRDVADAAIIGLPDDLAGELPKAYVVRQTGSQITADEIITYVADHVAPHMRLRGGVEFVSEIPRNPSGKVLRRMLRDGSVAKAKL